ncbi:MAG: DUF695 domain-containing protein [Sulfurimonadaceae bacterium]|jgi:hypothetical protein|nr:DUF695 domain-containing protein [Sulfurimonadaceae bacterium]
MREIFTRIEDNTSVNIEVETDLEDFNDTHPWLLSVFIKFVKTNEDDNYYSFLETKESLIIALEMQGAAHYAGTREVDGWSELYFYARNSKDLDTTVAKQLKDTPYIYESNVVKDAKWGFYNKQLLPTDLEFCHIESAKIIFLLEEEGDTLETEREVEFYAVFDTPTQKERFIDKALDIGYVYKDDLSTEEYPYGVAMTKHQSVLYETITPVVTEFFTMLETERAHYEGWSTVLISDQDENDEGDEQDEEE